MGRDCLVRPRWKILSQRVPASVADVIDIALGNRNLDRKSLAVDLKDLAVHLSMRGMAEGAELLANHMAAGNKIVLVADYDCDGITSAAQLALFLSETGYENFRVVIPSRHEGYGIPERAVLENPDAKVFVAMDCGTLDLKPVSLACSMGADCIVIDHHEVPNGQIAPASVLINPKHPECCSSFKEFSASGLTFLFLASLRRAIANRFPLPALGGKYLALAATGTVADLVPLVSANRILARSGLNNLNANRSAPLSQLADAAGLSGKILTAGHISFYLGPRINAAGRVSEGRVAYDLLTADSPGDLSRLALELNAMNAKRQAEEEKIIRQIRERFASGPPATRTLVLGDPAWPPGVVGIAASRIQQELLYAPVVILAVDKDKGIARGSARSISGFDIHLALSRCADLLLKWGGHKAAAGLTIQADRIGEFAARFEQVAQTFPEEIFTPTGRVDMELPLALAGTALHQALQQLEPHGIGNPSPVFALRNAQFTVTKSFGKEQNHLKVEFAGGLQGVFWRGAQRCPDVSRAKKSRLDVIFQIGWDNFYNKATLDIKDLGNFF